MKRITALILAVLLLSLPVVSCTEQTVYQKEENTGRDKDSYIQDYTDRIFWMFDGPQEEVTLRCRHTIMDQVIDKFGEQVEIKNVQKDTFDITIPVSISGTFYAWLFQFVGEMNIIAPGHVKDAYADYLQEAIDDVLGT